MVLDKPQGGGEARAGAITGQKLSILHEVYIGVAHELGGWNLVGKPVVLIHVRGANDPVEETSVPQDKRAGADR